MQEKGGVRDESMVCNFSNRKYRVSGEIKAILRRTGGQFVHIESEMFTRNANVN